MPPIRESPILHRVLVHSEGVETALTGHHRIFAPTCMTLYGLYLLGNESLLKMVECRESVGTQQLFVKLFERDFGCRRILGVFGSCDIVMCEVMKWIELA